MVCVVAERDHVDSAREELIGGLWRDPQPARDVLAVDDDEGRFETLAQQRQALEQGAPPDAADEIAHEQDARAFALGRGGLLLEHLVGAPIDRLLDTSI